jgi:hypothetical protein
MTFFYNSYEPRHQFVVQKITTHILTLKKIILLKRELCVLLNVSLLKCQSMTLSVTPAIWPLLCCYAILGVKLRQSKAMKEGGENNAPTAMINSRMSIYKQKQ